MDLWDRARTVPVSGPGSGDVAAGAMYQSVLARVRWGDVSGSPFLQALRRASGARLSVKFNVDGFGKAPGDDSLRGRVVGTVGPAIDIMSSLRQQAMDMMAGTTTNGVPAGPSFERQPTD